MISSVSFEFSCLGSKNLYLKQHQAMETEAPIMPLFVCNGTDTASIMADMKQMLDSAYDVLFFWTLLPTYGKSDFLNEKISYVLYVGKL
jgi:hypothetical protein